MRKRSWPCVTCWLSWIGRSTMWPLTFGAIPTKLARIVASSVSGRFSHCQAAAAAATTAPTRMSAPTRRPATRRHPPGASSESIVGSATEHSQPEGQGDDQDQPRIDQGPRPEVRVDPDPGEELPEHDGDEDAEHERQHPGREVRTRYRDVRPGSAARDSGAGRDGRGG